MPHYLVFGLANNYKHRKGLE